MTKRHILLVAALTFSAGMGVLTATALGTGSAEPARTTTITVTDGAQGPPGPAGGQTCPTAFSFGKLVINHPGGQVAIWTCIED